MNDRGLNNTADEQYFSLNLNQSETFQRFKSNNLYQSKYERIETEASDENPYMSSRNLLDMVQPSNSV